MPTISVPKENLEGLPPLPVGRYTVRLDGFKPRKSKKQGSTSINLNPLLTVINHPTLNDRKTMFSCNTEFPPAMYDMAHGLGVKFLEEETSPNPRFPGDFVCQVHGDQCDSSDPEHWSYIGPLAGAIGDIEVAEDDNGKGGRTTKLKRFFCKVPGCTANHKESLL